MEAEGWSTPLSLDTRVAQQLRDLYQQEESEGKLPSTQQLEQYYATFRSPPINRERYIYRSHFLNLLLPTILSFSPEELCIAVSYLL
jgi:hypothetical protein